MKTLLQSGNVVFQAKSQSAPALELQLEAAISRRFGIAVDFLIRDAKQWNQVVEQNPFPIQAKEDPSHLVVMSLKTAPSAAAVRELTAAIAGPEQVQRVGRELYIVYPDGIGRSKLTHGLIERILSVRGTGRNWNTVIKIWNALQAMKA